MASHVTRPPLSRAAFCMAMLTTGIAQAHAAVDCPPAPAPVRDIAIARFYKDAKGSVVDKDVQTANKAALAPIADFLDTVTRNADAAAKRNDAKAAACALDWIAGWARGDAWLGRMGTDQAEYQRKWDLAGVALAYLKLRPFAGPEQRAVIEPWLQRFADAGRRFFDNPKHRRNNHWYWLGLGLAATGMATDSEAYWGLARGIMKDAARDIAPDGSMKHEMERGKRALHYHTFSATPLVVMAELAAARGEDWYTLGDGALHRLVALTARGLVDRAVFDALAHVRQDHPTKAGAGWSELYRRRFPDKLPPGMPDGAVRHRWLGGDIVLLVETLEKRAQPNR